MSYGFSVGRLELSGYMEARRAPHRSLKEDFLRQSSDPCGCIGQRLKSCEAGKEESAMFPDPKP